MIMLQLLFTYAPAMNRFFHSAPISWDAWLRIIFTGVAIYCVVELEKRIRFGAAKRKQPAA
jgi:Ca2+-transporting ATPase